MTILDNTNNILTHLTSGLEIPMAIFDENGVALFSSKSLNNRLGLNPTTLSKFVEAVFEQPSEQERMSRHFDQMIEGSSFSEDIKQDSKTNYPRTLQIRATKFVQSGNMNLAVHLVDISQEVNLFSEIESLEKLASAGKAAAGVAHEFNNLLTAMLGWTQIAIKASNENQVVTDALKTVESNTRRARQIAGDLLDISRSKPLSFSVFSASEAVEDAIQLLSWELNTAQISVKRNIQNPANCFGDPTRIIQVFINIIRNAIEATSSKGTLSISVIEIDGNAQISFADSGTGIPSDVLDMIFEPFFSTKIHRGDTGGSGLGLAICQKIIKDHKGDISIQSRRPGGTTMTITLPLCDQSKPDKVKESDRNSSFPPGTFVLVVDDEPDICEMIQTALTLRGANVTSATSGEEAVDLCEHNHFDAAFLDFSMNGLSGHKLGNTIARIQPNLPIVFMSGVQIPNDSNPYYTDFLKKPFDLQEIQV